MTRIETTDGTELYVKQWGRGDRVLVLAHGWPLNADSWDDVALPLSEAGWRVVAYDRRGFGRSEQPIGGYDYVYFVDDFPLSSTGQARRKWPWAGSRWAAARSPAMSRSMAKRSATRS